MKYSRAYVEITNICNRSCSFCPKTKRQSARMTEEQFEYVVKEIRPLTDYVYFHVMGEPLTHPLLPAFIKHATSFGLKCAVTTNGTLLSLRGKELIDSGVYKVNISVHSFESGDDKKYYAYIDDILNFADEASRRGVLVVLRLWNRGVDGTLNDKTLHLIRDRFTDGEWLEGSRGFRIRHKLHLEWGDRFAWPDMSCDDGGNAVFCYGLSDHFGILADGTVIPCCLDHEGDIPLGNVFATPLADILTSERAVNIKCGFQRREAVEPLCRRCGYARKF